MNAKTYHVLFLCTGNSARSIMAEVLLNSLGKPRLRAFSAGSHPLGQVHPLALEILQKHGHDTAPLRSKSWNEFAGDSAPEMDFIFTLCNKAAGENCPVWPGHPITGHWGFEDPAAATGTREAQRRMFERVFREITVRIQAFLSLPIDKLDRLALQQRVRELGNPSAFHN